MTGNKSSKLLKHAKHKKTDACIRLPAHAHAGELKRTSKHRGRLAVLLIILILLIVGGTGHSLYVSSNLLTVRIFSLQSDKINAPIRIAVVADLHSKVFGNNNSELFDLISEQAPDVIAIVGDMLNSSSTGTKDMQQLSAVLYKLKSIAPSYYVFGNHERSNNERDEITRIIAKNNIPLFDRNYLDVSINGCNVRIGGIAYYRSWDNDANNYLSRFCDTDSFKLLLCHHPEFYLWGIGKNDIDLTVSGHTHGGQVRLPILGGVYAPEQGFFPEYDAGLFEMDNGYLAITCGLGTSAQRVPRFNNPPEVMIIDILNK